MVGKFYNSDQPSFNTIFWFIQVKNDQNKKKHEYTINKENDRKTALNDLQCNR